jgi:hypothetical protein
MRRLWVAAAAAAAGLLWILIATSVSLAQDTPANPDELNKKYQDALNQLKAAQDRKNELANENEKLKARIAELEKQAEDSKRTAATYAEQTYFLRSHYAAWQGFIKRYPQLAERWKVFLESDLLAVPWRVPDPLEPDWLATDRPAKSSAEAK